MYHELIYTRCRQGIDLLNSGRPITSDGFKVYSCTPALIENGNMDLQFLFNAAQRKQPYKEPDFMEDAYLYFVPDRGHNFILDFHPIPYKPTDQGNYSHRAGNFINQIFIGDFSDFYLFELFRDKAVWDAKERSEVFYYENIPTALPLRKIDVGNKFGRISIDEVAGFISDDRQKALRSAVSFLIAQFQQPAENRKFLVIRDESSEKIELWIAAIELAFSPRISAAIPFATRLEKFASDNRFTVNPLGFYQTQINLQDPNQKLRFRALVVGLDERDKANVTAARPIPNAPFVLIDGVEKNATFDADTSHRYYRLITTFGTEHQTFCREFLQMLDIKEPSLEILKLYDIYSQLVVASSLPSAIVTDNLLTFLGKYRTLDCLSLRNLYERLVENLPRFLEENPSKALQIIKWLQINAGVIGDNAGRERLKDIVSNVFAEQVFQKSDSERIFSLWEIIKNSNFATSVAEHITSPRTLSDYGTNLKNFSGSEATTFVLTYIECAAILGSVGSEDLMTIVDYGLKNCTQSNDIMSARKIVSALFHNHMINNVDILLRLGRDSNIAYSQLLVKLILEFDKSIVASDTSVLAFLKKLRLEGLEHLHGTLLKHRALNLKTSIEIVQFTKLITNMDSLNSQDLDELFTALDNKLDVGNKSNTSAAVAIQEGKPENCNCSKSAHLYALTVLEDKRKKEDLSKIFNTLILQGFPKEINPDFVHAFVQKIFEAKIDDTQLSYFIALFARVPEYCSEFVRQILEMTPPKKNAEWKLLISVAASMRNQTLDHAIIEACTRLNRAEKTLSKLSEIKYTKESSIYFQHVANKVRENIRSRKPKPGLRRLFSKSVSNQYPNVEKHKKQ